MNTQTKQAIQEKLMIYIDRFESQNQAANSLSDVSSATISQIKNNKWDLIKDEMWRNIASQIGYTENQWIYVETRDYKTLSKTLTEAQGQSHVYGVVGNAGGGKTTALKLFSENTQRTYLLRCSEFWNRKYFLSELLSKMGKDFTGLTVSEMMEECIKTLKTKEKPLIVLDEADKLTDQVLYFFITLYNHLEDHCGIVLCATQNLQKRIIKGVKNGRKGYAEIFSRLGGKFIELKGVCSTDVEQICRANGINNTTQIKKIFEDSEYDLRRVKIRIHATKKLTAN